MKGDLMNWFWDADILKNENTEHAIRRFLVAWWFVRTFQDVGAFLKEVWKHERS